MSHFRTFLGEKPNYIFSAYNLFFAFRKINGSYIQRKMMKWRINAHSHILHDVNDQNKNCNLLTYAFSKVVFTWGGRLKITVPSVYKIIVLQRLM